MKKQIAIVLLFLLLGAFVFPVTARADVIYEPFDSFYEEHREECVYVCRSYTATGPNGEVAVYESPESAKVEAAVANGEQVYISYTYEDADGILWGCCETWETDIEMTGWVPMDYMTVVYDGISFDEEYSDQYLVVEGQLSDAYLGKTIYLWEYPGSEQFGSFDLAQNQEYLPSYSMEFTDAEGRTWGKCSYYMGWRDYWINLDDPTADYETLFPDAEQETQPETEVPETQAKCVEEIVPKEPASQKYVKIAAAIAVAAVVAVTGVLLYLLKKKKP